MEKVRDVRAAFTAAEINADRVREVEIFGAGIPIGGLGCGYSLFGRYGFQRENFDSTPDWLAVGYPHDGRRSWGYDLPEATHPAPYALTLTDGSYVHLLQENALEWLPEARPVERVRAFARLPKGIFRFEGIADLEVEMTAFSALCAGHLEDSDTPAQIYDFVFVSRSRERRKLVLRLNSQMVFTDAGEGFRQVSAPHGETVFAFADGGKQEPYGAVRELELEPGKAERVRLIVSWYYPCFKTPSPCARAIYRRSYCRRFGSAVEVWREAEMHADEWSERIDTWHASCELPGCFFRLLFSSLSSLITGSLLAESGEYFEIETPHHWVNTMDVSAYSSWCVLLNFPELERRDMGEFFQAIREEGELAGFVWHSLWNDASHYAEEPTFALRFLRDLFWLRDRAFGREGFPKLKLALESILRDCDADGLIDSLEGNQSYDAWKMPGIGAYVNSAWIYALDAFARCAAELGESDLLLGEPAGERARRAARAFDRKLWQPETGAWRCFACDRPHENRGDSLFLEQMFGRWGGARIAGSTELFAPERVRSALNLLYANNLVTAAERFRGWANGMLPGHRPDLCASHAKTCWIGAQSNFGTLLALFGEEERALDVFASLEFSAGSNQLAVGEWNQAVNADGEAETLPEEPGKDTPRFPAYPRYKCVWEWIPNLLGLTLDFDRIYLHPWRSLDFALHEVEIAGTCLSVRVERDWSVIRVDGCPVEEAVIDRSCAAVEITFTRK